MKFFRGFLFFLIVGWVFMGNTQNSIVTDNINIFMDYGRYRYDDQSTYLEVYYSIFNLSPSADQNPIRIKFELENAENDSLLASELLNINMADFDQMSGNGTGKLGLIKTVLPQGKYELAAYRVHPESNQKMDSIVYQFSTSSFERDKIALSDLELGSNILPNSPNKQATFYKNTMEVIPNPSRVFGQGNPRLYYYIELYNTKSNDDSEFQIQTVIADKEGNIRAKKDYKRNKKYESLVEKGAFDLSKFESGLYTLIFAVTDSSENYSVYRRANFVVNNPDVQVVKERESELSFLQSEFYEMPEDIVDRMFDQVRYIASQEEARIYKSLNSPESKRKFLFDFWNKRNKQDPEMLHEYYRRVEYANENFRSAGRKGWETDRGRVYILYGPPDNIERSPSSAGENPYQIWFYEGLQGGSEFDFVDFTGHGDYQLVNSTVRGEIQDPNWRNYIYQR